MLRDEVIADCIKAIDGKYAAFKSDIQQESVLSNLIPDVLSLGLSGGAALAKDETAKAFTQGSIFVAGAGKAINKDVYYTQTLPAVEATMDANRATIKAGIINSEKADATAANYTLDGAELDLLAYQNAGNLYLAIATLNKAATDTATSAQADVQSAQNTPYEQCLPTADVQARLLKVLNYIKPHINGTDPGLRDNPTDRTTLDKVADALAVTHTSSDKFAVEQGHVVAAIMKLVTAQTSGGACNVTALSTVIAKLSPIIPAIGSMWGRRHACPPFKNRQPC
ncbi:MAG TPA: hypothetical protein VGG69_07050 [Rhizomicrobium sp.]